MDRISKPRVFLSHSKKDIEFIERVKDSLRKCNIEPWLDDEEIRHGKPWLEAIFEDGIPNCDAVLVYFTESSLASRVVKKELDAGVVSKLEDEAIALLPYVNAESLRDRLRSDIKSLHVPEWNETNFGDVLARCAAEIWRSFHERKITQSIAQERVRRLEAERETESLKSLLGEEGALICGRTFVELLKIVEESHLLDAFLFVVSETEQLQKVIWPDTERREKIEKLISIELVKRIGDTGRNSRHLAIGLTPQGRNFATEYAIQGLSLNSGQTSLNSEVESET